MKKTIFSAFLVFALVFSFGNTAQAQTNVDQTLLQQLSAQIESLRMQLGGLVSRSATTVGTTASVQQQTETKISPEQLPTSILRLNAMGPEVTTLQKFLVEQKLLDARFATGVYDANTATAVRMAQSRSGARADGTWGPRTADSVRNSWGTSWGEGIQPSTDSSRGGGAVAAGGGVTIQPVPPQTICLPNSAPWIKVLSPNGGEVFTAGQQITVTWTSCNLPNPNVIVGGLHNINNTGSYVGVTLDPQTTTQSTIQSATQNDGQEVFTLPSAGNPIYGYGTNFKISLAVAYYQNGIWGSWINYMDLSDNLFTINATGSSSPLACNNDPNPVKLIMTSLDSNGGSGLLSGIPIVHGQLRRSLNRLVLYSTCDVRISSFEIANTDYFASLGFSRYRIHEGYGTSSNDNATGQVLGVLDITSNNPLGGFVQLNNDIILQAHTPKAITISGDVISSGNLSDNIFQVCAYGPGMTLRDGQGNLVNHLPANILPTTILGRETCGKMFKFNAQTLN